MTAYANISGSSPIESFALDPEGRWIEVRFRRQGKTPTRTYRYSDDSCPEALTSLIELATAGSGLATFIARERPEYDARR